MSPAGIDGFLNINKPPGPSSYDMIRIMKKIFPGVKIGHAGTLDPFAEGVLVLMLGAATRSFGLFKNMRKRYIATVRLGRETDTGDRTGRVVRAAPPPPPQSLGDGGAPEAPPDSGAEHHLPPTKGRVINALESLVGKRAQRPPKFSALKLHGRPMYEYARKGIDVEPAPREIEIFSINLVKYEYPDIGIDTEVGSGTYIRSLACEIGEKLGLPAHLDKLVRTAVGPFTLKDAHTPAYSGDTSLNSNLARAVLPMDFLRGHIT